MEHKFQLEIIFGYILAIGLGAVMLICVIAMAWMVYTIIKED